MLLEDGVNIDDVKFLLIRELPFGGDVFFENSFSLEGMSMSDIVILEFFIGGVHRML